MGKSLVFKSTVVLVALFLAISGIFIYMSYTNKKEAYYEQMQNIHITLRSQIEDQIPIIRNAKDSMIQTKDEVPLSEDLAQLQRKLNLILEYGMVENTYMFIPGVIQEGDKKKLRVFLGDKGLHDFGFLPGSIYEPNEEFHNAFVTAERDGNAVSEIYSDEYGEHISYMSRLQDSRGNVVAIFGNDFAYGKIKKDLNRILLEQVVTGALISIIFIVIATFLIRRVLRPVAEMTRIARLVAEGDLTVEEVAVKTKDEVGQLAVAINTMAENIRALIRETSGISEKVSSASEELTASSNEMTEGIEQVSATAEELAAGANNQAEQANNTLEVIREIDFGVKQINDYARSMEESSNKANQVSNEGLQSVQQSVTQIKSLERKVNDSSKVVFELADKTKEISEILNVITDIANQTNLLALNAAIEAARAGEQGRGFAVVADEVRKLAEQAGKSTSEISEIIYSVEQEAQKAGVAMSEVVEGVKLGSEVIDYNGQAFNEIADVIKEISAKVGEISRATEDITHKVDEGVNSVESIAAITEESSAGTEELSASMEQQNASMQEINGMASQLAQMAEELNQSLAKFKI